MYTCTACGSNIPDNKRFCPQCGAMMGETPEYGGDPAEYPENIEYPPQPQGYLDYGRAPAGEPYYPPDPAYNYTDPAKDPLRVLGVGEFFFSMLLLSLPVIGFIFQIIWACGGARSRSRVNLARAYLIFTAISAVLFLISAVLISAYVLPYLEEFLGLLG